MAMHQDKTQTQFCLPQNDYPKVVVLGAGFAGLNFIKSLQNQLFYQMDIEWESGRAITNRHSVPW